MSCWYTYTYLDKKSVHTAEECGNTKDIDEFYISMEYAASQFDTIPECKEY